MRESLPVEERVINREAEVDQFSRIVMSRERPCVVTVEGPSGIGKSSLLELLEAATDDAELPVARWVVPENSDLLDLTEAIATKLATSNAACERYKELDTARAAHQYGVFGWSPPQSSPAVGITINDSVARHNNFTVNATVHAQWSDDLEEKAQERCREALLDDLREHTRRGPVVLLLDQYDNALEPIKDWLTTALLRRVFGETGAFGPLILVVASNGPALPRLARRLGERRSELFHAIELRTWQEAEFHRWTRGLGVSPFEARALYSLYQGGRSLRELSGWAAQFRVGAAA